MRAALRIQAFLGYAQPLNRPPSNQMLFDDLRRILRPHVAIPHGFRINHDGRPVLALIQAA